METIGTAGNVLAPAVLALRARGFAVSCTRREGTENWSARSASLLVVADDPVQLLGLVALREQRGPNWKASDREVDAFLAEYQMAL